MKRPTTTKNTITITTTTTTTPIPALSTHRPRRVVSAAVSASAAWAVDQAAALRHIIRRRQRPGEELPVWMCPHPQDPFHGKIF
ncbi:MAG: hypothetical protein ACK5PJ_03000 [Ralstonia sp.]